ncbi:MAG: AAA family ATPase, partial [Actinomycetota bacterium]
MRIESVTAHAFGPLADERLELAPGMNVIAGVNESAKSSWHAAIYAALVGRRRGKGAPTKDERAFIERHRPWDQQSWRVSAIVALDDGRRIELTHDLDGKVDCRATDLALGRDVSDPNPRVARRPRCVETSRCPATWEDWACPESNFTKIEGHLFGGNSTRLQAERKAAAPGASGPDRDGRSAIDAVRGGGGGPRGRPGARGDRCAGPARRCGQATSAWVVRRAAVDGDGVVPADRRGSSGVAG